ncbi:hypothetical protein JHW43_007823 [Diplocarpon mali]|nr:hypothetical protein JHW43_007823 [Diplocarpon mali]
MQDGNNFEPSQKKKKGILVEPPKEESWLQEVKSFAEDFTNFQGEELPSTPKADLGIGPVKYAMKLIAKDGLAEKRFQLLDRTVNLEKMLGDYWIKVEATLMFAAFGVEDPLPWLPAMQHYAIRMDLREMTTRFVNRHGLVRNARVDHDGLSHMVQDFNQIEGSMNRAEVLLMAQFVPKRVQATSRSSPNPIPTIDLTKFADIFDRHQMERGRVEASHNLVCRLVLGAVAEEESMPDTNYAAIDPQLETDPDILKQSLLERKAKPPKR